MLVIQTRITILVYDVPTRKCTLRSELSSIRHSDDESYGCETYRVFCSAIVIMSLFTVIPQGPFVSQATENNCPYRRVVGF